MLPEIVDPDWLTELATSTAMKAGSGALGGRELLPGRVDQDPPQSGGLLLRVSAKPWKLFGAPPPLNAFTLAHWALQKVTAPVALRSPTTNEPLAGKAKMSVA